MTASARQGGKISVDCSVLAGMAAWHYQSNKMHTGQTQTFLLCFSDAFLGKTERYCTRYHFCSVWQQPRRSYKQARALNNFARVWHVCILVFQSAAPQPHEAPQHKATLGLPGPVVEEPAGSLRMWVDPGPETKVPLA